MLHESSLTKVNSLQLWQKILLHSCIRPIKSINRQNLFGGLGTARSSDQRVVAVFKQQVVSISCSCADAKSIGSLGQHLRLNFFMLLFSPACRLKITELFRLTFFLCSSLWKHTTSRRKRRSANWNKSTALLPHENIFCTLKEHMNNSEA